MFNTTSGKCASVISANDSCINDRPCPVEPVAGAGAGRRRAPRHADRLELALGVHAHAVDPGSNLAMCSSTSVNGVIG